MGHREPLTIMTLERPVTCSAFLSFLSLQLLPKCSSDLLLHCTCPPARDWGSRVSGLVSSQSYPEIHGSAWAWMFGVERRDWRWETSARRWNRRDRLRALSRQTAAGQRPWQYSVSRFYKVERRLGFLLNFFVACTRSESWSLFLSVRLSCLHFAHNAKLSLFKCPVCHILG